MFDEGVVDKKGELVKDVKGLRKFGDGASRQAGFICLLKAVDREDTSFLMILDLEGSKMCSEGIVSIREDPGRLGAMIGGQTDMQLAVLFKNEAVE